MLNLYTYKSYVVFYYMHFVVLAINAIGSYKNVTFLREKTSGQS